MNEVKESKGIKVLEIPYMGRQIHPTLIWDEETVGFSRHWFSRSAP